jgi:putative ABC transport system permease protein
MHEPLLHISWWHMPAMLAPLIVVLLINKTYQLAVGRSITIATLRSMIQLAAVGMIIGWVFEQRTWYTILSLLAVMTFVASFTAAGRFKLKLHGYRGALSLILAGTTAIALSYFALAVVGLKTWDPRYLIPIGGMLLGNTMTASTLAADRLHSAIKDKRHDILTMLAMGAAPKQTLIGIRQQVLKAAMTPTINTMMVVGVVQLPGMMTGQMLGGSPPIQAAMYQLMILIGIMVCATIGATLTTQWISQRFFTSSWQLREELLRD